MPPDPIDLDHPSLYINRELSWLEFNRRVLEEARDPSVPLLERLKFLAIFSGNLDEFFMVRVGGLHQKIRTGITHSSGGDHTPPADQMRRISELVREMVGEQSRCLNEDVLPALAKKGVVIRDAINLTAADAKHVQQQFKSQIFPVLTPLATDPAHPFPHLLNKSLNLAVMLHRPNLDEPEFAVVQVPSVLQRMLPLPSDPNTAAFVPLEVAIRLHLPVLFPGLTIERVVAFRVTRDSEFELDEDVEDLLRAIEENVKQRRRGEAVRLELEADAPPEVEQFLTQVLDLSADDVYRVPALLDLTGLFQIHGLPGFPDLRDPPFTPALVKEFTTAPSPWAAIRAKDILLHHPYESFKHVVDFIDSAAGDERVLAIKQTLYRTSSDSAIVQALLRAADKGKQVTAVVELKARLDEERNIQWAKMLEKAGVHVVFGFVGLKTHCKVALVVRRDEDNTIRRYVHLSTGNYNPQTARLYTDLCLFTCNPDVADDATLLFNHLTGNSATPQFRKLVVAPARMQPFMIERIEREAANQRAGKKSRIAVKVNGLLEPAIVKALYRASQAGVPIEIVCRGICALRPGLPGVSETVRVISVVDRFLEHSRIFYFENDGTPEVYVGSADWMDRNLSRRVEVVFPVEQADLKARMIDEVLAISLADTAKARQLLPDGTYQRVTPEAGQTPVRSQTRFLELAAEAERRQSALTTTVPTTLKPVKKPRAKKPS
ncbi:MAG: polyphosphate kinase 1 [Fimbriiglobus sp.]|jgi:polyphosphate kinase|nr:polyphosphate kinase 1 [Fimbriiglobus sp.]